MKTKSSTLLFLIYFLLLTEGFSQQYQWRLGISTGYTNHYGQLSTYRLEKIADIQEAFRPSFPLVPESNWNLSLEKRLTAGLGLSIHGGKQSLAGNAMPFSDQNAGQQHSTYYQSSIWNIGSTLVFRMDNGKILSETSLLAPYALIGMGWHIWESQTLTPLSDSPLQGSSGIEEGLATRQDHSGERYYLDMGLGLRLRLSQQFDLFIQSNAQTNGTHFFRRSMVFLSPTEISNQPIQTGPGRDWLFQHQVGIKFRFAPKRSRFKASVISPSAATLREDIGSEGNGLNPPNPATIQDSATQETFFSASSSIEKLDSMASPESPIPHLYSQSNPESGTVTPPSEYPESKYLPLTSRAYAPELEDLDGPRERSTSFQSFYPVYPVYPKSNLDYRDYPESYSGFKREENQQEQRTRSFPSGRYSNSRQNQSSNRVFVPIIVPLSRRTADSGTDPAVAERTPNLPMALSVSADSLSGNTGLRLNPQVLIWSKTLPIPRKNVTEIVIQNETIDSITAELSIPAIYTDIYFEINQSELSEGALTKLGEIVRTLERFPDALVSLKGYADHTGSVAFNLSLVEKRTNSVAQALVEKFGIAKDRIQPQPGAQLVRTRTPSALPEDRKVEVQILFLNSGID